MSPNPDTIRALAQLDVPLPDGGSPFDDAYAGAVPEITAEDVDGAFPTECVEMPLCERIALALLGSPNVHRPTHDVARWIRETFQP